MRKLGFNRLKQNVEKLVAEGRLSSAFRLCEKYLLKHPDDIQAMTVLGLLSVREKDYARAMKWLLRAYEHSPHDVGTVYNLAKCMVEAGEFEQAEKYYRQVIRVDPQFIAAYFNLANVLRNLGRFDEAAKVYRQAIVIDPRYSKSFYALSLSKKFIDNDPDLRVMEKVRYDTSLDDQQLMYLLFALSKAYDDIGLYDESFECLLEANRIMRASYRYQLRQDQLLFEEIKRVFNEDLLDRLQGCGSDSLRPVFILGMPRSGTTLVEQILSSHPEIHGAGEIDDLGGVIARLLGETGGSSFPRAVSLVSCEAVIAAAKNYNERLLGYDSSVRYVINKVPGNYIYIGMIKLLFPHATVIHCRRDPLATCFSIFRQCFSSRHDYAYDLSELGAFYRLYSGLMDYWRSFLPDFIFDVDYESVIADQRKETGRMLNRLGVPWSDECMRFQQNARIIKTVSVSQVRKPIYTDSLSRWSHYKSYLSPLVEALEVP